MSQLPLIAIDLGFGQCKGASIDGRTVKVPSWTSRIEDRTMLTDNNDLVQDGDHYWLVGDRARLQGVAVAPTVDSTYYQTDQWRVMLRYMLNRFGLRDARIVTGLPIAHVRQHAQGLRSTILGMRQYGMRLEVVSILPQPVGSMMYLMMDGSGVVPDDMRGRVGIVDIGSGTIDAIEVNDGVPAAHYRSEPRGVHRVYEHLYDYLRDKKIPARLSDMPTVMQQGTVTDGRKARDVSKAIAEAKAVLVRSVAGVVEDLWGSDTALSTLIITGGGAALARDELEKRFQASRLRIPKEPDLANVRGYLRAANWSR